METNESKKKSCVSMDGVHFSAEQVEQCVNFCAVNTITYILLIDVIYIVWL